MSLLSPALWITQLILWSLCLVFAKIPEAVARHNYCPNVFKTTRYGVFPVQHIGTNDMPIWAVPSLFVLYALSFFFALNARRREMKARRYHHVQCVERRWYIPFSQQSSPAQSPVSRPSAEQTLDVVQERMQLGQTEKPPASEDQSMGRLERPGSGRGRMRSFM